MTAKETVRNVAKAARISLTSDELKMFGKDLNEIMKSFAVLEKVPPAKPRFHPLGVRNATRKDSVEPSLPQKTALANTKNKKSGFFTGPGVV